MPTVREQLEAKYGKASTTPSGSSVRAQLEAKYSKQKPIQITGSSGNGIFGAAAKGITDFGVGVGTTIGKAGLGLGEAALKGVGEIAGVTDSTGKGKKMYQNLAKGVKDISTAIYDQPQFTAANATPLGVVGQGVGNAALYLAPSGAVTKAQGAITGALGTIPAKTNAVRAGVGAANILGRAIPEAVAAGGVRLAQTGGDTKEAGNAALLAGGLSAGLQTLGATVRAGKEALATTDKGRGLLSYTSKVDKGALETANQYGINKNATPEHALEQTRQATRLMRKNLTKLYDDGVKNVVNEYEGVRTGLTDSQIKNLKRIVDEFNIDEKYLPQNLKSFSAKEAFALNKGLNSPSGFQVAGSPKGASLRELKDEIKPLLVNSFGGESGSYAKLLAEYSQKKGVLDTADEIVDAFSRNDPKGTVTAKNRLMSIFNPNKPEFLKAVQDLEKELGMNFTRDVASIKFSNFLPKGGVGSGGPINAGIRLAGLPLTSPKLVGEIVAPQNTAPIASRAFGQAVQGSNSGQVQQISDAVTKHFSMAEQIATSANPPTQALLKNTIDELSGSLVREGNAGFAKAIQKIDLAKLGSLEDLYTAIQRLIPR